jgi:hypothetical protein
MSCNDCSPEIQTIGSNPAMINWKVVRGDTSRLRIEFLQNDESSNYDTSDWTYVSTAYNKNTQESYTLEVTPSAGYVDIVAPADVTAEWGAQRTGTVAELDFDLQVTFDDNTVWTPVVGVISVTADITLYGGL